MVEMGDEACAPEAQGDAPAVSQENTLSKRKHDSDATSSARTPAQSPGAGQPTMGKFFQCKDGGSPFAAPASRSASSSAAQDGASPKSDAASAQSHLAATSDGRLIPASFVSFYEEPKGGFTPIYEPEDGCSYSNFPSMASVNAGAFRLYVGGGAINRGFALTLKAAGHTVSHYEDVHVDFRNTVLQHKKNQPEDMRASVTTKLHFMSEFGKDEPADGMDDSCLLMSELPNRFISDRTRAGTVYIDTFVEERRPFNNITNGAMVYVVGPEGDQAENASDFVSAVQYTGSNLYRAVALYNQHTTSKRVPISYVRVCLVSGGLFRHADVTKTRVAEALIAGISAAFYRLSETSDSEEAKDGKGETEAEEGGKPQHLLPHINFAFDDNCFHLAYKRMQLPPVSRLAKRQASSTAAKGKADSANADSSKTEKTDDSVGGAGDTSAPGVDDDNMGVVGDSEVRTDVGGGDGEDQDAVCVVGGKKDGVVGVEVGGKEDGVVGVEGADVGGVEEQSVSAKE